MPKTNNDGAERRETSDAFTFFAPDTALAAVQPVLRNVAEMNGKVFAGWTQTNSEWISFLSRRFQEDAALVQRLSGCANPNDVYEVYSGFVKKAVDDYREEFAEMIRLGQASLAETTGAARKAADAVKHQQAA